MEKIINVMPKYEISIANQECLKELSRFVVEENYKHHSTNPPSKEKLESDIMTVYNEEKALYSDTSNIYIARYDHKIIGSIRVFKWDRKKELPIEKMYGINPLKTISHEKYAEYWHIGRFAIAKDSGISTLTLFKRLMALAVKPIVEDKYSYMIAEIDSKLLKVMKVLGFGTRQIGKSIDYLTSETVPVCSSKRGIKGFFSKYGELCKAV
ncbi:N-acyl amino acid synthase FeeM domain-containing protein [Segatella bryantii]|nr:hypothetical protein [Segatella bryantii]MDR4931670.1 hypothetical protein [Segatella bryantii]OYP53838.1 hypothetical protein CIK91_11020 [Segatella bryantii]UKK74786.1 hypothetical protein L6471_03505 [Segatella bryantii]UKK82335.1 hypothetical protein L6474_10525 [Segatella bryantii]